MLFGYFDYNYYFILGWELLGWQDKAKKSLQKSVIFYQLSVKAKKRKNDRYNSFQFLHIKVYSM